MFYPHVTQEGMNILESVFGRDALCSTDCNWVNMYKSLTKRFGCEEFYPDIHDLVMNAEVSGLGITFQFRYKDTSGDGCYIWADGLQLTDSNLRIVEKIRDAFLNWKQSLVDDGDLLDKLNKEANKD